jgi:hypothetical protein
MKVTLCYKNVHGWNFNGAGFLPGQTRTYVDFLEINIHLFAVQAVKRTKKHHLRLNNPNTNQTRVNDNEKSSRTIMGISYSVPGYKITC